MQPRVCEMGAPYSLRAYQRAATVGLQHEQDNNKTAAEGKGWGANPLQNLHNKQQQDLSNFSTIKAKLLTNGLDDESSQHLHECCGRY